jgi:hypothetical protein
MELLQQFDQLGFFIKAGIGILFFVIILLFFVPLEELQRNSFSGRLLERIRGINVKNLPESDVKEVIVTLRIKLLIESSLTKISEIKNNTSTDDKEKFSVIVNKLSKTSKDLDNKKRPLKELKNCFTIVDYINNQLCEVLKTKTN